METQLCRFTNIVVQNVITWKNIWRVIREREDIVVRNAGKAGWNDRYPCFPAAGSPGNPQTKAVPVRRVPVRFHKTGGTNRSN